MTAAALRELRPDRLPSQIHSWNKTRLACVSKGEETEMDTFLGGSWE